MSLSNWIIIYLADLMFLVWILMFGGAEMLGESPISGIFIFLITFKWKELSAEGIKFLMTVVFIAHTLFFLLGLTIPAFRAMLG